MHIEAFLILSISSKFIRGVIARDETSRNTDRLQEYPSFSECWGNYAHAQAVYISMIDIYMYEAFL